MSASDSHVRTAAGSAPPASDLRARLRTLHARGRRSVLLHRLVIGSRVLLAVAFLPTGTVKLLGRPFTVMGSDTAIGLFFVVLYQSGIYWNFLGLMQVAAAILVLIPATTALGAALFFPIVLNIFVITVGVGFQGTPWVTGAMVLAALLLLCWDYHRWEALLFAPRAGQPAWVPPPPRVPFSAVEIATYAVGLGAGMLAAFGTRSMGPRALYMPAILLGLAAGFGAVVLGVGTAWRARVR